MKRAALYARFSSELQSDRSVEDQLMLCRAYCIREGYAVVAEHHDRALSGASVHGRAGLATLRADVLSRRCDVVVVEDFDRLSRGMGDLPKLWEEMQFAGVQLIAVNDGAADQIKIGVRGIVGALYLTDLRNKTLRGLEGNLREGKRAGGMPFGYRPILGKPGEHEVYEPEAEIIRRIFSEYAAGLTPRKIAYGLNSDGIKPNRGRGWNASTINGSAKRSTGILANEVYRGEIVWNKVGKMKNPATGKRVPRINPPSEWRHVEAPQLRIIDDELWEQVRARRAGRMNGQMAHVRGPQRLLSGLLKCSACGCSIVSAGNKKGRRVGMCTRARESGSCDNKRFVYLDTIEAAVIEGLRDQLANPDVIAEAVREFHAEMRRLAGTRAQTRGQDERRLGELKRAIDRIVEQLADGSVGGKSVGAKLAQMESEAETIEQRLAATASAEVLSIHPKALDHFLRALDELVATLERGDRPAACGPLRELVDSIIVYPREANGLVRFDVRGRLAALLDARDGTTSEVVGLVVPRGRHTDTHHQPKPLFMLKLVA